MPSPRHETQKDKSEHNSVEEQLEKDWKSSSGEESEMEVNEEYKQLSSYQSLPSNVQHAIDISKRKAKHSDFYMQLQDLTDKITVYKQLFCTKQPHFVK